MLYNNAEKTVENTLRLKKMTMMDTLNLIIPDQYKIIATTKVHHLQTVSGQRMITK